MMRAPIVMSCKLHDIVHKVMFIIWPNTVHFNFVIFQYKMILVEKFCHKGDMQSLKECVREINAYVVFSARMIQTVKWIQEFKVFMALWQWLVSFSTRGPENSTNTPRARGGSVLVVPEAQRRRLYVVIIKAGCQRTTIGKVLENFYLVTLGKVLRTFHLKFFCHVIPLSFNGALSVLFNVWSLFFLLFNSIVHKNLLGL